MSTSCFDSVSAYLTLPRILNPGPQPSQHPPEVPAQECSDIEPKPRKHVALEQSVGVGSNLLIFTRPQPPPDDPFLTRNPRKIFANPVTTVSAFLLVKVVGPRAGD